MTHNIKTEENIEMARSLESIEDFDVDGDGKVSNEDIARISKMLKIGQQDQKALTQKRMAWTALLSMTVLTAILYTPFVSEARVNALSQLLGLFYIAEAGIVGAYMGVTAWMSRDKP